jgi:hypothetical protein
MGLDFNNISNKTNDPRTHTNQREKSFMKVRVSWCDFVDRFSNHLRKR